MSNSKQNTTSPLLHTDIKGNIIESNDSATSLFGYDTLTGMNVTDLIPKSLREKHLFNIAKEPDNVRCINIEGLTSEGKILKLSLTAVKFLNKLNHKCYKVVLLDFTNESYRMKNACNILEKISNDRLSINSPSLHSSREIGR